MFIQVAAPDPAGCRRYSLDKPEVVVGRSQRADVVLHGDQVSRVHCRLWFESGSWRLEDANSANGVYLDRGGRGAPFLARHDVVVHGDHLYIGRYRLSVLFQNDGQFTEEGAPPVKEVAAVEETQTLLVRPGPLHNDMREWLMNQERESGSGSA